MTLNNQQVLSLSEAITALDGSRVTLLVDGKAVEVWRGYKLSPKSRLALARAQGVLSGLTADFHRAKDALIKQHAGGESAIGPASPHFNSFSNDFRALTQQPVETALPVITEKDLHLDENEIPISVLNALLPIIQ